MIRLLIALYPRPFRERFGADLAEEVRRAGPRSWPDVAGQALLLWLHPAVWPARNRAERQLRALAGLAAAGLSGCLITHAVLEMDGASRAAAGLLDAGLAVIVLGLLLLLPVLAPARVVGVVRAVARPMLVPGVLGAAVVAAANRWPDDPGAPLRILAPVVLAVWWLSLGLGVAGICRAVVRVAGVVEPPSPTRMRTGALLVGAGTAAVAAVLVGAGLLAGHDLAAGSAGAGLLALTFMLRPALADLADLA